MPGTKLFENSFTAGISVTSGVLFSASAMFKNCIRVSCAMSWSERIKMH